MCTVSFIFTGLLNHNSSPREIVKQCFLSVKVLADDKGVNIAYRVDEDVVDVIMVCALPLLRNITSI